MTNGADSSIIQEQVISKPPVHVLYPPRVQGLWDNNARLGTVLKGFNRKFCAKKGQPATNIAKG